MARHGFGTALLDEIVIPLTVGKFAGKLGYEHPAVSAYKGHSYGVTHISSFPIGANVHELPPEFENRRVVATFSGKYFGSQEELHVIGLGLIHVSINHIGQHFVALDARGLELGEPLVRLAGYGSAVAVVAVLEETVAQPASGSLAHWGDLFRTGVTRPSFPDASRVARAVDALDLRWPKGHSVNVDGIAFTGRLPASILGALVLGDEDLAEDVAQVVNLDPRGVREVLADRFPPAYGTGWRDGLAIACVALGLIRTDEPSPAGSPDIGFFGKGTSDLQELMSSGDVPCLRILNWTTEERVAKEVGQRMMSRPRSGPGEGDAEAARASFALSHRDIGASDAASATWREVRASWMEDVSWGQIWRADRAWQGWATHALAGILAVLGASWMQRRPKRGWEFSNGRFVFLALAGILFVDSINVLVLATPILWWACWGLGFQPPRPRLWEHAVRTAVLLSIVEASLLVVGLHSGQTIATESATIDQGVIWLILAYWLFKPSPAVVPDALSPVASQAA